MAKGKKTELKWWWIVIPFVAIVLFVFYNSSNSNVPQSQQLSKGYFLYQDPTYQFSIEYPETWEIRRDTQVFENGDAIAFGISGTTQKKNTELTDGAQVVVSKPFSISQDLSTWVKNYYDRYSEFSKNTLGGRTYQKVYSCGYSCMTYYYTQINDQIYGVAAFAEGPDKDKMVYENAIVYMLKSLQFDTAQKAVISKEDAISKVKSQTEVKEYFERVPNALVTVSSEKEDVYMIQVYEIKDRHTATFNWYTVHKTTGEVKKEF